MPSTRHTQARIDAEQEALNEKFRKESESDFAFMSVFGVVTCGRGVQRKRRGVASTAYRAGRCRSWGFMAAVHVTTRLVIIRIEEQFVTSLIDALRMLR